MKKFTLKEFLTLFEDKVEFLANQQEAKILKAFEDDTTKKHYFKDSAYETFTAQDIVKELAKADPTEDLQKNLQWIVGRYIAKEFSIEDIPLLKDELTKFEKIKPKLRKKDINMWKDLDHLYDIIDAHFKRKKTADNETRRQMMASGDAKVILNSDNYQIIIPKTREAAKEFGCGSSWCTSKSASYYAQYTSGGAELFIIKIPNGQRFQFSFDTDEFRNLRDQSISETNFFKKHPKVVQALYDYFKETNYRKGMRKLSEFVIKFRSLSKAEEKRFKQLENEYNERNGKADPNMSVEDGKLIIDHFLNYLDEDVVVLIPEKLVMGPLREYLVINTLQLDDMSSSDPNYYIDEISFYFKKLIDANYIKDLIKKGKFPEELLTTLPSGILKDKQILNYILNQNLDKSEIEELSDVGKLTKSAWARLWKSSPSGVMNHMFDNVPGYGKKEIIEAASSSDLKKVVNDPSYSFETISDVFHAYPEVIKMISTERLYNAVMREFQNPGQYGPELDELEFILNNHPKTNQIYKKIFDSVKTANDKNLIIMYWDDVTDSKIPSTVTNSVIKDKDFYITPDKGKGVDWVDFVMSLEILKKNGTLTSNNITFVIKSLLSLITVKPSEVSNKLGGLLNRLSIESNFWKYPMSKKLATELYDANNSVRKNNKFLRDKSENLLLKAMGLPEKKVPAKRKKLPIRRR